MDLAQRFLGMPEDASRTVRDTPRDYQVGDSETFNVLMLSGPSIGQVSATVHAVTENAYFFVEDGFSFSQSNLDRITGDFESIVYPTVTEAFGGELEPGVDSDPRITVLHVDLGGAGGYFSASDQYPSAAAPRSNERSMIYLDRSILNVPGNAYNALAAHELQHMINYHHKDREDAWVNEGLSQVAMQLIAGPSNWLGAFLSAPDTQLNHWPFLESSAPHYAASELFFSYLLDRYGGPENAHELLAQPGAGIAGVESYLAGFETSFVDVFADWVVANYVNEAEGTYSLPGVESRVSEVTNVTGPEEGDDSVSQFGARYIAIDSDGAVTFSFEGATEVDGGVPPRDDEGGDTFWWSDRGDWIDSRLTRGFDLSGLETATLRFQTWYEIERGWDYAYVAVSTDDGRTWEALPGRFTTEEDPVWAAYGPAYTGSSGAWRQEEVDLTPYAGGEVLIRFEYITDDAIHLTGFAVDNVEIPELGFLDDSGSDEGWLAEGFVRVTGPLEQEFLVQLIEPAGQTYRVTRLDLDATNSGEATLGPGTTVVISGITRGTTDRAEYSWAITVP
jgi:immune inhibitor A